MNPEASRSWLVPNRTVALIALILTGYVAALTFREAFFGAPPEEGWLFTSFFGVPRWGVLTVNFIFYVYVVWCSCVLFRAARGKERVVVAGWFLGIFLYPVETLLPSFGTAARYIDAAAMGVAFLAALSVFLGFCSTHHSRVQNDIDAS